MTLSVVGREAVVHVLTLADNIDSVITLTNHSSMDGDKGTNHIFFVYWDVGVGAVFSTCILLRILIRNGSCH